MKKSSHIYTLRSEWCTFASLSGHYLVDYTWYYIQVSKMDRYPEVSEDLKPNMVSGNSGFTQYYLHFHWELKFNLDHHHLLHTIPLNPHHLISGIKKHSISIKLLGMTDYESLLDWKCHVPSYITASGEEKANLTKLQHERTGRYIDFKLLMQFKVVINQV